MEEHIHTDSKVPTDKQYAIERDHERHPKCEGSTRLVAIVPYQIMTKILTVLYDEKRTEHSQRLA